MASGPKKKTVTPDKQLSKGHKFVCWDVDATGRLSIDEICQISAYTANVYFQQYIMPYRDVDYISKKRHLIQTVTVGRYRVLRQAKRGGRVLKTKSELYGLIDFLDWIESIKGDDPIVLVAFEQYKLAPWLLIEGLKRYNLLERFKTCVSGFANAYHFVKQKCELSMSSFSLRTLAKILLNKEQEETYSAFNRAKLSYEIIEHLCTGEFEEDEPSPPLRAVQPYLNSVEEEENQIEEFKSSLVLQNTLKPIFSYHLKKDPKTRKRAVTLRWYLTNAHISFDDIKEIWGKNEVENNLEKFLDERITFADSNDKVELVKIIEDFLLTDSPHSGSIKRGLRKSKKYSSRFEKINDANPVQIKNDDSNGNVKP